MIILLILQLLALIVLIGVIYFIGRPMIGGAIYFSTSPTSVKNILKFADIQRGQSIIDLGSGDGRVLIAAAELGANATGYEINAVLVRKSRRAIARAGLQNRARVEWKSLWKADLSHTDTIVVYGIPYIMDRLSKKIERECKPRTKIISNVFSFHRWKPVAKEGDVYLYIL